MITLTDENFEKEIQNTKKPVLVDFWSFSCPPCLILSSILEKIEKEFNEKIILAKVNLETAPIIAQKFGIDQIPTVILFKEGKPVSGFVGIRAEPIVRKWLEENLKNDWKEKIEQAIKEYQEYAEKNKFRLNPDRGVIENVIRSLLEREEKLGARYCPCRRMTGNKEEDKKIICPCQFHHLEIERDGHCFCGLFVK